MKKRNCLALLGALCLCSCQTNYYYFNYYTKVFFSNSSTGIVPYLDGTMQNGVSPFDTIISLVRYSTSKKEDIKYENTLNNVFQSLHAEFDANYDYVNKDYEPINNIKTINDNYGNGKFIDISDDLSTILKLSIEMTKLSKGKFNVAIGSLSTLWDKYIDLGTSSENLIYDLPSEEEIEEAASCVPSYQVIDQIIEFNGDNKVRINKLDTAKGNVLLSLGAIGKGYATQKFVEEVKDDFQGYISSGESSISTINESPFGSWKLALSNPLYVERMTALSKDVTDYNKCEIKVKKDGSFAFSTSGDYIRFYYDNDHNLHHHIINPDTGYSSSYYRAVSVLCDNSTYADAITTSLMNMSIDEGINFIKALESQYSISINPIWMIEDNGKIIAKVDSSISSFVSLDTNNQQANISTTLEYINNIH